MLVFWCMSMELYAATTYMEAKFDSGTFRDMCPDR